MNAKDVDDLYYSSKHPAPEDLEETQDFLLANDMQKKKIDIKSMIAEVK